MINCSLTMQVVIYMNYFTGWSRDILRAYGDEKDSVASLTVLEFYFFPIDFLISNYALVLTSVISSQDRCLSSLTVFSLSSFIANSNPKPN